MTSKAIIIAIFTVTVGLFTASSSFAQRPTPVEMCGLLGVGGPNCPKTRTGTGTTTTTTTTTKTQPAARYTDAQVNQMNSWINYWNSEITQWTNYRDSVARYWNDPYYYQWARSEYNRSNQILGNLQQWKASYQNALRSTGQL